jgi:glycosyltransferase involved in cell wall biosynthesis
MRIAVLVHNDVVRDIRIQKEASTLVAAGHDVHVFGLSSYKDRATYPAQIAGARLEILRSGRLRTRKTGTGILSIALRITEFSALVAILLLCADLITDARSDVAAHATALLLPLGIIAINSWVPVPWRKLLALAWAVLSIIASAAQFGTQLIGLEFFVASGVLSWALFRYKISIRSFASRLAPAVDWVSQHVEARLKGVRYRELANILAERVESDQDAFDVVHCHDLIALIAGGHLKRCNPDLKLVWDAHEIYEAIGTRPQQRTSRAIIRKNSALVDEFITINDSLARFYRENHQLPAARVIMNATRWDGLPSDDGRLRRAAGLSPERRIVLFQGGLAAGRGLTILQAAAARLPEPWSLVVMGWGPLETKLREAAAEVNRDRDPACKRLVLIPPAPVECLAQWTAGADIGIIPYENTSLNHLYCTPNKLWEFPNAGVPILATGFVEMEKIIVEAGTGYLLPIDFSAADIINFLTNLDPAELAQKKLNCANFSRDHSWERFEPTLLSLYERLSVVRAASNVPISPSTVPIVAVNGELVRS